MAPELLDETINEKHFESWRRADVYSLGKPDQMQGIGSGFWLENRIPGFCTSKEERFLKFYLDDFKSFFSYMVSEKLSR